MAVHNRTDERMKKNGKIIRSGGIALAILLAVCLASCQQAEVTLIIGSGSGAPGSENNIVEISIDNPAQAIKGIQADVCDEGNYLQGVACEPVGSASEFTCAHNELADGCFRIMILSLSGKVIPEDAGHIINVSYNVSASAPEGSCSDLTAKEIKVSDEATNPLAAVMQKGSFCF
jgi:hypothetical protein